MSGHVTSDILEQYVIGALDAASVSWVETHAADCQACAAALEAEARLELGLFELAAMPPSLEGRRKGRAWLAVGVATALAGAAMWLFLVDRSPPADQRPSVVRCSDAQSAAECIARAQFDGVLTIGPDQQLVVPRYEAEGTP